MVRDRLQRGCREHPHRTRGGPLGQPDDPVGLVVTGQPLGPRREDTEPSALDLTDRRPALERGGGRDHADLGVDDLDEPARLLREAEAVGQRPAPGHGGDLASTLLQGSLDARLLRAFQQPHHHQRAGDRGHPQGDRAATVVRARTDRTAQASDQPPSTRRYPALRMVSIRATPSFLRS